jgi:azurin
MKTTPHAFHGFRLLLALAVAPLAFAASPAAPEKSVVIVTNDAMKFSVTRIEVSPGQPVHVELRNEGTMPKDSMGHNWILLKAGSDAAAYAMAAIPAKADGYQPKALANEVVAVIPLLGPKETGSVSFAAPTKPGVYPYICSCSGHSLAGMRGELVVK